MAHGMQFIDIAFEGKENSMNQELPIDRVRERENNGPDTFDDARETYRQKEAEIDRQQGDVPEEKEPDEDFEARMRDKLTESGKDDTSS